MLYYCNNVMAVFYCAHGELRCCELLLKKPRDADHLRSLSLINCMSKYKVILRFSSIFHRVQCATLSNTMGPTRIATSSNA